MNVYEIELNGQRVSLQLSPEDAKNYADAGVVLTQVAETKSAKPSEVK